MLRCIVVWLKACLYLDGGELWRIHQSAEHFTHPLLNRVRDRCHGTSGSRGHCLFDAKHLPIGSAQLIMVLLGRQPAHSLTVISGSLHGTFTLMKKRNTLLCEVYRLAVLYDRLAVSCCQKVNV